MADFYDPTTDLPNATEPAEDAPKLDADGLWQIAREWMLLPREQPLRVLTGEIVRGYGLPVLQAWGELLPPEIANTQLPLVRMLERMVAIYPGNSSLPYDEAEGLQDPIQLIDDWALSCRRVLRRWVAANFRQFGHQYHVPDLLGYLLHGSRMHPREVPEISRVDAGTGAFVLFGVWALDLVLVAYKGGPRLPVQRVLYDLLRVGGQDALAVPIARAVLARETRSQGWRLDGAMWMLGGSLEPLVTSQLNSDSPRLKKVLESDANRSLADELPGALFVARHGVPLEIPSDFDVFARDGLKPLVNAVRRHIEKDELIEDRLVKTQIPASPSQLIAGEARALVGGRGYRARELGQPNCILGSYRSPEDVRRTRAPRSVNDADCAMHEDQRGNGARTSRSCKEAPIYDGALGARYNTRNGLVRGGGHSPPPRP